MPQLTQAGAIYASQLFWLVIVFALIYLGIGKAMVPRIERTVDDRAARIAGDLAAAENARTKADEMQAAYQAGMDGARAQAMKAIAEAQAKAAADLEAKLKASDADDEAKFHAAFERIEAGKTAALAQVEAGTVEAVRAIVAKLSGVEIDHAAAEGSVKAEMAHG